MEKKQEMCFFPWLIYSDGIKWRWKCTKSHKHKFRQRFLHVEACVNQTIAHGKTFH